MKNPNRYGRKPIEIDGVKYSSLTAAAERLNLTKSKLTKRIKYTKKDKSTAILTEIKKTKWKKKERDLTIAGKSFTSIADLSKHYKVGADKIRSRLDRGRSIEEAVGLVSEKKTFPMIFDGQEFKTAKEIASFYKVKHKTFVYRLNVAKWPIRQALGLEEKQAKGNSVKVNGLEFSSMSAVSRYFKINRNTFSRRIRDGWSLEEACGLVERASQIKGRKIYVAILPSGEEEIVSNLSHFCRKHNLKNISNLHVTLKSKVHHSYRGYSLRHASEEEASKYLSKNPTAFSPPKDYKVSHEVEYKGETYPSKRKLCDSLGISYRSFCSEVNYGKTVDEAVNFLISKN